MFVNRTSAMAVAVKVLGIFLVSIIHLSSGYFILVKDAGVGKILFDASIGVEGRKYPDYHYRVSHHKTQAWVHRLLQFDSSGILRLKRSLENHYIFKSCQSTATSSSSSPNSIGSSSFVAYIDIFTSSAEGMSTNSNQTTNLLHEIPSETFDYISFPLTIIVVNGNCPKTGLGVKVNPSSEIRAKDEERHWLRSVDDIYVSLPVSENCNHASEKLSNINNFLPTSVREACTATAAVVSNDGFFAIEQSTGDIIFRADFCLFELFHTAEILLKLECRSLDYEDSRIVAWDQLIHFIIHRYGRPSTTTNFGGNKQFDIHPIHRIRREMRNQSPFFEHPLYKASVPEEQLPGITVTTITATDPENTSLSYSMTSLLDSRSQQFFQLDSKSGIITTVEELDREKMDVHYFRIIAMDSGIPPRTGTATLEINVIDTNDHTPIFEQSSYQISIRESLAIGSTVISIRATDQDIERNGDIVYSIINSRDIDDVFRVNERSGVITTRLSLDREKRDEYSILVQATDQGNIQSERKSSTTTVRIEILDDNDNYPQWTEKIYNVTVQEDFDVSNYPVIARVSATDADEGVNAALRYSIIGGNTQNHFSIDSLTGEVALLKGLDFESQRSFRLNIRAIDSGNPSRSNNTQLVVTVGDVNDNSPRFYSPVFQETVQENLPPGSSIIRIQAFDPDDGPNAKISYRLSFRENPKEFPFTIDPDLGWIKTNSTLDREQQNRYDFNVVAADSGNVPLSATASVILMIQDENDNDPTFSPKLYETTVSEQELPGTPILTLKATDPDENTRLTFEITEGNTRNRFSISQQNGDGILAIAQPLDFKTERKFVLTVKALDGGGRFDLATVYIDVIDANTNAPAFQNTPYSVRIFEDIPIGSVVFTVVATDQDSGQNAQVVYTFVALENENEDFMIDSSTGVITTVNKLDREKVSGYILTVRAKDKGIPPLADTTDIEIVINDVNDNVPVFEKEFYQAKVSEDVPVGSSILQVQAEDADQGKNNIIRYTFSTFSDGDGTFSVDGASGVIRTVKPLDRETVSRYDLMVLAIDHGSPELTGKTNVTINVLDINDSPPMFESDRIRFFITENSPLGSKVGTIQAYDPDEGANAHIVYSIVGGVDADSFTLVTHQLTGGSAADTADILTRIELDFESPRKKFDIIIRAASPPLRNDVHVEISVTDVNDNGPTLQPSFQIILNNYKDYFPLGPIGRIPAFDADVTDKLSYTILSGNKANFIYLNESTGDITLSPYLDTNVPLTAKIEVLVSDGLNEVRSEMILKTRMITDELLYNSITVQLEDMTLEAFLSPLYTQFLQALGVILNSRTENIIIFSVQEEIEGSHGVLNVSFAARKHLGMEEYFSPDYIKERVFLNRVTLSKLSTMEVLPFTDDLCLLEPCPNFEDCHSILRFRNATNFISTPTLLFRSVLPMQTFTCTCPPSFTGVKEHYLCDAEINLCFSTPCLNGGTCRRRERGFTCVCPPEFTGSQCEIHIQMDTCQPNICSRGSTCLPKIKGGFTCSNCSSRGDYVNSLCELRARSFSRGSYMSFPGIRSRYRFNVKLSFATQQRNGLLLYNGRYNERFDFIALEIVNSTVRFSFSLGSSNVTRVDTGLGISDGIWHTVEVFYSNKTGLLSIDDCDVIMSLQHPEEFPPSKSCAGKGTQILENRCNMLIESCQRFLDLTGPLYIGGLPAAPNSFQIETHDYIGCIKDVYMDHKFLDFNNYVMELGTTAGCPEKKTFCSSQPCKNGGKCLDGWGTYRCGCSDGFGQKDCSEDAKPVWNLKDEASHVIFAPQLRPIQFPWYNSISIRTLHRTGVLMSVLLNNNTISLSLDNGLLHYTIDGNVLQVSLPRVNDGYWHNVEIKWMTAEIWFSLDYGQYEITIPFEGKVQGLYVSQVTVGSTEGGSLTGCFQDVRVGVAKSYLREPDAEKNINLGCNLATACIGATCPPRSTCIEEAGRHKCRCDPGYIGIHCSPICDLKPCLNNGTCSLDLTNPRGYTCKCDDYHRGVNCEDVLELSCPLTWWNWPDCAPCHCNKGNKNFSPDCNKKSGKCKCKEYHYEKDGSCIDCGCYSVGSVSRNCDLSSGKCQCRNGVSGTRCEKCNNPLAEVTSNGCETIYDGCPRSLNSDIWWPRVKFATNSVHDCPLGAIGLASRECTEKGWNAADIFNCSSTSFISILNIISQMDNKELTLSPLLSTKLAGDLYKALNVSNHLYGNDLWSSLRLLTYLIKHETAQKGLFMSHRQDSEFVKNLALAAGKITSAEYYKDWNRIRSTYGRGSDSLLKLMEQYLEHLTINQEDTFTKPFEIITPNLVLGLDTVELTWENNGRKNFESLEIQSSYDLYEVNTAIKTAVRFPKYDNIVKDPKRHSTAKVIIPLDILGITEEQETPGNAVVGYIEYNSLWDVLPKIFQNDVDKRFNSDLVAYSPVISLSILASQIGIRKGKQSSPIRISYEIPGRYMDSSNPQCVVWEEPDDHINSNFPGGWTTRACTTQVNEIFQNKKNVMLVNCTCWHLSTFALLIENNEVQDIPRPQILESIVSYIAFILSLILIFGALIALGLLKGPVPSTITNTIHKHLLFSIFCSLLLYFLGLKLRLILVQNDNVCRTIAIGLHYFWLCTFGWLFGSSLHLRRIFTEIRNVNHGSALLYFGLGYGFPLFCVALSLGVRGNHYGNKFFCWLSLYEGIIWGMVGPILLCVFGTLLTFLIAVRAAFTLKDHVVDSGNMRTLLWMDMTLLPICGMVWALCLLGANERNPLWQYGISAAVIFLSLYIALGYCVLNQRVKDSLYIRAGNLFRPRDEHPSNISRSALAYRSDSGLRADDLRRDMFRGARSMGISTASTTSRSTTKTSSSPYHTYGGTPVLDRGRAGRGTDSMRKTYPRRRKRSNSDEERSSDPEHAIELASSHSSDEDEAGNSGVVHNATLDLRPTGAPSSGNSGSDNETTNASHAVPQEYGPQKVLNSSENLHLDRGDYGGYGEHYLHRQEPVNDLNGSAAPLLISQSQMSPQRFQHHQQYGGRLAGSPQMSFQTFGRQQIDSPISPVAENPDEMMSSEHEMTDRTEVGGMVNPALEGDDGNPANPEEDESEIYGGSMTSGVLV